MNTTWHLQQVFSAWVLDGARHDHVQLLHPAPEHVDGSPDEARVEDWPVTALLDRLGDDETMLPELVNARMGLPARSTFADAVRVLTPTAEVLGTVRDDTPSPV